jgi:hypothetical protein
VLLRFIQTVFTITIKLDPPTAARVDRLLDLLDGKQQKELDALVARLKATQDRLRKATADATPS